MVDLSAGQRPPRVGEVGHHRPFEALVEFQRPFVVAELVGQQRQRQLRRAAAAIAPLKAGRTVTPQVEPGIEWSAINANNYRMAFASARIRLHTVLLAAGPRFLGRLRLRISVAE